LLEPFVLDLGEKKKSIFKEVEPCLTTFGFVWELHDNQCSFTAMPVLSNQHEGQEWLMDIFEDWLDGYERVESAQALWTWKKAKGESIRNGQFLTVPEMRELVFDLLKCENPFFNPDHKKIIFKVNSQQIQKAFVL
jgi:DNA mismatch repair ATPase MutL